jgi:pyridoxal phosphate enzyme (YggS family)
VEHIAENLVSVEERIAAALARCGRKREEITLIAVTKTFPAVVTQAAWEAGLRHFGENYVQEFEGKAPELQGLDGAQYHLIGHLQSNKVNKAVPLFDCIQTVDSLRLATRIAGALQNAGKKTMDLMIEVKLSEEESKHGCPPGLTLLGLMTMPPFFDDPEKARPYFACLRELAAKHSLAALSMGMSNDFEVAIEEGATHIRLGTVLFGRRTRPVG